MIRRRSNCEALAVPNRLAFASALTAIAPPGPTWYCSVDCPDAHTALPATEMLLNVVLVFALASTSAMRPPQPYTAPSGTDACQTDC